MIPGDARRIAHDPLENRAGQCKTRPHHRPQNHPGKTDVIQNQKIRSPVRVPESFNDPGIRQLAGTAAHGAKQSRNGKKRQQQQNHNPESRTLSHVPADHFTIFSQSFSG